MKAYKWNIPKKYQYQSPVMDIETGEIILMNHLSPRDKLVNTACNLISDLVTTVNMKVYADKSMRTLRTQTWTTYYESLSHVMTLLGELSYREKEQIRQSVFWVKWRTALQQD